MSVLSQAITDAVVRRLAGPQAYRRGLDYFRSGHVTSLEHTKDDYIRAIVRGAENYAVNLTADEGVLDYSCDCPMGSDGSFCKHCVATSLAWLDAKNPQETKSKKPSKAKKITVAEAAKLLQEEEKDAIISLLVMWAKDDSKLRERLILFAARGSGTDASVATVRRAFEKAVRIRGFLHYREVTAWARHLHEVIDSIEQVLKDGHSMAVIDLCESALGSLVDAVERMDDSYGHFSALRDRLEQTHYEACAEARPDPVELAKRLFDWQLHGSFDVFYEAVSRYAEILGPKGMTTYRDLAEAEWTKVPVRTAKDQYSRLGGHSGIRHIMESLAEASGDLEQLVSVVSRDLSSPYDYLQIAELYRDAEQYDQAVLWAEKGLNAFPNPDLRLLEFAANEYHRRDRHEDAMKLMWSAFIARPYLERYITLESHAIKAGSWPEWRERALGEIRRQAHNSRLVEILLYEKNPEQAWSEAQSGGCSDSEWLQLAAAREQEHPEDAALIYLNQAVNLIARIRDSRYEDVIELLLKAAAAMKRSNQGPRFVFELQKLCAQYKSRRNFIALVNKNHASLYLT
jgi:uncharacterized Zn finger protein